jgi:hypothetical protein
MTPDHHLLVIPLTLGSFPLVMLGTKAVFKQVLVVRRYRTQVSVLECEVRQFKLAVESMYERIRRLEEAEHQRKIQDQQLEEQRQRAQDNRTRELIQFTEIGLLDERII